MLADDLGRSWHVRLGDDVQAEMYLTAARKTNPYRTVTFTATQTRRPS